MTEHHHEPEVFEESDWQTYPLKWIALATAIFLFGSMIAAHFTIKLVNKVRATTDEPTIFPVHILPPTPRLQTDEPGDLRRFKAHEQELLTTYSWIDPQQGTVRLPIERAMELTAQELGGKSK